MTDYRADANCLSNRSVLCPRLATNERVSLAFLEILNLNTSNSVSSLLSQPFSVEAEGRLQVAQKQLQEQSPRQRGVWGWLAGDPAYIRS